MADYVLSTDSTADLPADYIKEKGIVIQSLHYCFGNDVYGGDREMPVKDFYARMRGGEMPTTNATVPDEVRVSFKKYLNEGKDILHISFSSALSSSYSSTSFIADELRAEFPNRKIIIIDSLCASLGQGLLVHKACEKKASGMSIEKVAKWVEENKLNLVHKFTVNDLFHLHRGGRVSKTTAIIGTLINIKPVLHVDNEGRLTSELNVRGRKKSLTTLVDEMGQLIDGFDNDIVFISHGDCVDDANYVADLIRERYKINNFIINYVGPTIGAHSGPGTVALFFMGKKR
ncbi:MAG: DegV family protein [Lachnospiraceae bacterium]|nr:DegV family protein [Lachnospiraceae bacterium]